MLNVQSQRSQIEQAIPVYVLRLLPIQLDEVPELLSTDVLPDVATLPILARRPVFAKRSVTPLEGKSSIGTVEVEILNYNHYVEDLLASAQLMQRSCTLHFLWAGDPWAAALAQPRFVGQITEIIRNGSGTSYTLTLSDAVSLLDKTIFDPPSIAAEPFTTAEKTFPDPLMLPDGVPSLFPPTCVLTQVQETADGLPRYDTVTVSGHPVNIALGILNSGSGDGLPPGETNNYDLFPAYCGLAIPRDQIDLTSWERVRDETWSLVQMSFTLNAQENAKQFIEEEICRVLGGYLVITGEGKIGIHCYETPIELEALQVHSDDNIVGIPVWSGNYGSYISHFATEIDHDGFTYITQNPVRVSAEWLSGIYQVPNTHQVASRGLQTALGAQDTLNVIAGQLFYRYGSPLASVTWSAFFDTNVAEPGDIIKLTSITYPFYRRDTLQGKPPTRLIELLSVQLADDLVHFEGVDLTPLLLGPEGFPRLAIIQENGLGVDGDGTDYLTASSEQRRKAFLADGGTSQMSNGDAPYVWA